MDNNFEQKSEKNKPRKKVTKKVLRQRQLTALSIIALIVLLFFILIAKGCSNNEDRKEGTSKNSTTTTQTTGSTTELPKTTTVTTHPLASSVKLSTRSIFLDVGETGISYIQAYPEGCTEENEVWRSLDPSIASVDKFGHIEGIATGETFVILSFDNSPGLEIEIKVSVAGGIATSAENPRSDITSGFGREVSTDTRTTPVYGYPDETGGNDINNF